MIKDFIVTYREVKKKREGERQLVIETNKISNEDTHTKSLLKKLFMSKSYNNRLVAKLSEGQLNVAQMKQIKRAIENNLSDKQLDSIVQSKKSAETLAVIIDIAVTLNKKKGGVNNG